MEALCYLEQCVTLATDTSIQNKYKEVDMRQVLCKLKKQIVSSSLAVALGVGAMAASTAQAAEHNWRFANLYTRGTAFGEVYGNLAKNIEEMSGGRIKVKMMYAGEGVDTKGILGAVKTGLITMGATFQPMNAGELPAGIVEIADDWGL